MTLARNWLLPEHVEDMLPHESWRVEGLRRRLLELFRTHGYELVIPPMLEYLESLLTGTGHDLDLRTLKVVDQLSGRLIGIRADITPQVARIDAHLLNRRGVARLCYCGTVLHALPAGFHRTREPLQIGAELYGHAGVESDIEIQRLMLDALAAAGLRDVHLDLGHVGLFEALAKRAGIDATLESELFQALELKDVPAVMTLTEALDPVCKDAIRRLPTLYGGPETLDAARAALPAWPEIVRCLDDLTTIVSALSPRVGALLVDLAELRGYHYHSGVVFAAYAAGSVNAVGQGGRYDEVGAAFGRARPATGFSIYLRELAALASAEPRRPGVLAPLLDDPSLQLEIDRLRASGEIVVTDLPGHETNRDELGCDRRLASKDGAWRIVPL
ncbi:MAG: ATP phosphoribosyltransferase regulatory subunit [Burkholderiales bacterium]|nr:ATP phosphoribosyltransferase regulatory subunit [Burkholderiales bacterium]